MCKHGMPWRVHIPGVWKLPLTSCPRHRFTGTCKLICRGDTYVMIQSEPRAYKFHRKYPRPDTGPLLVEYAQGFCWLLARDSCLHSLAEETTWATRGSLAALRPSVGVGYRRVSKIRTQEAHSCASQNHNLKGHEKWAGLVLPKLTKHYNNKCVLFRGYFARWVSLQTTGKPTFVGCPPIMTLLVYQSFDQLPVAWKEAIVRPTGL